MSSQETETVRFAIDESIVVTSEYVAQVPEGLSPEEKVEAIQDQFSSDWAFQRQITGPANASEPHKDTVELLGDPIIYRYEFAVGVYKGDHKTWYSTSVTAPHEQAAENKLMSELNEQGKKTAFATIIHKEPVT